MKLTALFAFLLTVSTAQSQELKFHRVEFSTGDSIQSAIHFFCSQDYEREDCLKDIVALRRALAHYPTQLLGQWSFYLVMAQDWKPLVKLQGGEPVIPAFSSLRNRATALDRSLFTPTAERSAELIRWYRLPIGQPLIDLAITHEMGHALCQEKNERLANEYGKDLQEGKIPQCRNAAALHARASK